MSFNRTVSRRYMIPAIITLSSFLVTLCGFQSITQAAPSPSTTRLTDALSNTDTSLKMSDRVVVSRSGHDAPPRRSASVSTAATDLNEEDVPLFSFVVLGDSRLSTGWIPTAHKYPWEFVSDFARTIGEIQPKPSFVAFLGDMATTPRDWKCLPPICTTPNAKPVLAEWIEAFGKPLNSAGIPVFPVMGNHETFKDVPQKSVKSGLYDPEEYAYSLRTLTNYLTEQGEQRLYPARSLFSFDDLGYGFDYPAGSSPTTRFFVLNFYTENNVREDAGWIGDITIENIENYLADADTKGMNIIVFGHTPLYNNNAKNVKQLVALLHKYNARAYFSGHAHIYRHALIAKRNYCKPPFFHEFVSGGAGAELDGARNLNWVKNCQNEKDNQYYFYSVARRFNYFLVQVYDEKIVVTGYITKSDLLKANNRKSVPEMVPFERFLVMSNGETVSTKLFCNGQPGGPKPSTKRDDVLWCDDFPTPTCHCPTKNVTCCSK